MPTLDGAVLVTLAKLLTPVTGRQVHQLTGMGSEAGVRNVLNRLVHQGIVRASPAGSAWLYVANREHVAWIAVEALAALRTELLSRLRSEVGMWKLAARSAAMFGSAARGDGDADSDIDILLVHTAGADESPDTWQAQVDRLRELVPVWTGNACQVYDIHEDEILRLIAERDPVLAEWRRDAIPLAGTGIRNLLRDLGYRMSLEREA
ncbi:nucleotidyltransferase domain-containing protein [Jatrophihabitans sp.]|uniref:nucleotidyltransferase domain-containing protein n=1 Tax=Jatrophihabitans sp. TaxID=1932789 RepID=UPI002EFABAFD